MRWPWARRVQENSYDAAAGRIARAGEAFGRVRQRSLASGPRAGVGGALSQQTVTDSGMVSRFEPAQHVKRGPVAALIGRITQIWGRTFGTAPSEKTTEQGAASAASPATFALSLWQLRYDRRAMIEDCRMMILDDPRARRATAMYAREAVRDGCRISIKKKQKGGKARGVTGRTQRIAEECARNVERIYNPKAFSFEWMRTVEGDLFVQAVVAGDEIVEIKRMPATAMERNSDDTDRIINPAEAFSQVDVVTNTEVASFPLALMYQGRWNHIDGERYGVSEIVAGRYSQRTLRLQEDAQAVRRMTRAAQKRLWSVGNKDDPGDDASVKNFRAENGMVEGRKEIFDPSNVATDVFGNGLVSVMTADGDANLDAIADLKYAQNVYGMALPTPAALMGLDSESINRDVLTEIYAQWLKDTATLTEAAKELVRWVMDLQLLLKGILPEAVAYDVHYSESSVESKSEIVTRILDLRQNIIGSGKSALADPLISRLHALQLLAEIIDVEDAEAELAQIAKELDEIHATAEEHGLVPGGAESGAAEAGAEAGAKNLSPLRSGRAGRNGASAGNGHRKPVAAGARADDDRVSRRIREIVTEEWGEHWN